MRCILNKEEYFYHVCMKMQTISTEERAYHIAHFLAPDTLVQMNGHQ
jgi:hypothetical protein